MSDPKQLLEHLFRHESGKLVSVLTKIFGPQNLELAEDVVQDTLLKALDYWKFNGTPQNPSAWLFTVARNKALDVIRRERHYKEFSSDYSALLKSEYSADYTLQQVITENEIEDEQLRMMFVCCHPDLQEEGQVALILKTLCGFSVSEIAHAFITNEETITKRLYRARQQFRESQVAFSLPSSPEIKDRMANVLTTIYLIFNEGYNSTHHDSLIRDDLVEESLRLGKMLTDHPLTKTPEALALLALMCFQAARLYSRVDADGQLLQLKDQDRSRWDAGMIRQGTIFLQEASQGEGISSFHLEAAIAHEHCMAPSYQETDWKRILQLYDWLLEAKPDGLIALNRLIIFAEVHGPQRALEEIDRISHKDLLIHYHLFPAVLAEWHTQLGNREMARKYLGQAMALTNSPAEKNLLQRKVDKL